MRERKRERELDRRRVERGRKRARQRRRWGTWKRWREYTFPINRGTE